MKTELTLNVLQTMNTQEYEDIRAAGSDERRELTHAVMRELDAPDNWTMNGEYGSEFGGFFPVQVRFTPAHERFHLALCSPGDVSQVWVLVLVNAGGEPFAVVQVQRRFAPEAVSHSRTLFNRRLASLGVPRLLRAISRAPSQSISTPKSSAERSTIV